MQFEQIIIIVAGVMFIFIFIFLIRFNNDNIGLPLGKVIPDLNCKTIEEKQKSLHHLIRYNNVSFVCIVSPGCNPCEKLLKELFQSPLFGRVKLLTFGGIEEIKEWLTKINISVPFYILESQDVYKKLKITVFPFGMIVNQSGEIMKKSLLDFKQMEYYLRVVSGYREDEE